MTQINENTNVNLNTPPLPTTTGTDAGLTKDTLVKLGFVSKESVNGLPDGPLSKSDLKVLLQQFPILAQILGADKSAQAGTTDSISSVNVDQVYQKLQLLTETFSTPLLQAPNTQAATRALVNLIQNGGIGGGGGDNNNVHYNKFLGGLVTVALLEAMMAYMKSQQAGAKIASEMWVDLEKQTIDMARSIAADIEKKAQDEAMEKIATAVLSAATVVVNIGGLGFGAYKAGTGRAMGATEFQMMQMGTNALNTMFTGVTNNLFQAVVGVDIGHVEAEKTVREAQQQILQQMMSKVKDQNDQQEKDYDSFNDALKQWLTKVSQAVDRLTAH